VRLVRYAPPGGRAPRVGALLRDDRVLDLRGALTALLVAGGGSPGQAAGQASATVPDDLETFIAGGPVSLEAAARAVEGSEAAPAGDVTFGPGEVKLLAPLPRPGSIRDFAGFEDHARAGAARRGVELAPGWHDRPFGYRGNHRAIVGPDEAVARPGFTSQLDFELEVACIVGREVRDAGAGEAAAAIFGFTVMNDWSARDLQRAEMESRMGPSKSKDFATSLGPCILVAEPGTPHPPLAMSARVNGEPVGEGRLDAAFWTFPALIAYASQAETVWPGDVFGSGTPFGGCLLDHGGPWLQPGDVVELEVEGIGVLRNTVTSPTT
jgi:2-keto-4-pentenoate hydratase/2-oxohepta-3-ene-1,7-dioic acid hydratase in catechol pathway